MFNKCTKNIQYQIKTSLRFQVPSVKKTVIRDINDNKCWQGCGKKEHRVFTDVSVNWGRGRCGGQQSHRSIPNSPLMPILEYVILKFLEINNSRIHSRAKIIFVVHRRIPEILTEFFLFWNYANCR